MALSIEQILDFVAPQYASETALKATAIELAVQFIPSASKWGTVYNQAVANLAAHLLILRDPDGPFGGATGGGGGALTSVKTGDLAVGYGASGDASGSAWFGDASLMKTTPGQEYLRLRDTRAAGKARIIRVNE